MTTIDEIGRRAARDALADARVVADADAGFARLLADADTDVRTARPGDRRWVAFAAAGTVAAAVVALVVVLAVRDDEPEPLTPVEPTVVPVPTTVAPASTVAPATTAAPTTTNATTTTTSEPPAVDDPVASLAEAIGASTLVTRAPGRTSVFAGGGTDDVATPTDAFVFSDGEFLWWSDGTTSTATTLDGTVVCEVEGSLHRIRADGDGYVASVEQRSADTPMEQGEPYPNDAVDCETGERQPIEPILFNVEGGGRFVERVGDRTFEGDGDAEGNATIVNEAGVAIDGGDYAGYHTFDEDGSRVAYLVMDAIATPHASPALRVRDTTTGELLWSLELDDPAAGLWWYGDRILAVIPSDLGLSATAAVVVIDATTGIALATVPTTLDIAHIG